MERVNVIGGGLAGPEAAWQLAQRGVGVRLWEMRPRVSTPAHRTAGLGELVCSNSLKSETAGTAPWLLKRELRRGGSLLLACADATAMPAGQALSVDRVRFSELIEARLTAHPLVELVREEARELPARALTVVASGPLTAGPLAAALATAAGAEHLYFYDAISPIVEAASVRHERAFAGSRYGKGGDDYLNCPLDREEYARFFAALAAAESYPLRGFEETRFFEACLPLEELARRGAETLRHGPMKPVGLRDPRTGREPFAAVQLRRETLRADSYNLVGFQNHLRFGAQAEVLRCVPALAEARFLRFGQIHRNTYLRAPAVLDGHLRLRRHPHLFVAGQLSGAEGYVEAIATGWAAGVFAAAAAQGREIEAAPRESALGSLLHYITHARAADYAPANMTFDLLPAPPPGARGDRAARRERQCAAAEAAFQAWCAGPERAAESGA